MTNSIFKDFDAFNKALSQANVSLGWDKSSLVTDTLTIQKKGGFFRGLKVIFLSLFRPFGYDQFSHVKVDKVADSLFKAVQRFCKTGEMNEEAMDKVALILTRLNERTKEKYIAKLTTIVLSMEHVYKPVEAHKKIIKKEAPKNEELKKSHNKRIKKIQERIKRQKSHSLPLEKDRGIIMNNKGFYQEEDNDSCDIELNKNNNYNPFESVGKENKQTKKNLFNIGNQPSVLNRKIVRARRNKTNKLQEINFKKQIKQLSEKEKAERLNKEWNDDLTERLNKLKEK